MWPEKPRSFFFRGPQERLEYHETLGFQLQTRRFLTFVTWEFEWQTRDLRIIYSIMQQMGSGDLFFFEIIGWWGMNIHGVNSKVPGFRLAPLLWGFFLQQELDVFSGTGGLSLEDKITCWNQTILGNIVGLSASSGPWDRPWFIHLLGGHATSLLSTTIPCYSLPFLSMCFGQCSIHETLFNHCRSHDFSDISIWYWSMAI